MSVQWRPSNGTMGELWMGDWCGTCLHDPYPDDMGDPQSCCPIIVEILCGYSETVITGPDGDGVCTKYRQGEYVEPDPPRVEIEGQTDIFTVIDA